MQYYLDFDRTIFDTDRMVAEVIFPVMQDLGASQAAIAKQLEKLNETGYTVESHADALGVSVQDAVRRISAGIQEGDFVFEDALAFLNSVNDPVEVLTFGVEHYQRFKWNAATALHTYIQDVHVVFEESKGDFLAKKSGDIVFVDDSLNQIHDVEEKAPHVNAYLINRAHRAESEGQKVISLLTDLLIEP